MKHSACVSLALVLCSASLCAEETARAAGADLAAQVKVDPRVELISIVFRLAGNPEYNRCLIPSYNTAIDAHFKSFQDHALVRLARTLFNKAGVSYDAPMGLAVRLPAIEELKRKVPKVDAAGLDARWKPADLKEFLRLLPRFVREARYEDFLKQNEKLYQHTAARAEEMVRQARLEWFDRFFGKKSVARFHLALGLTNGPNCYGARSADGRDIYCILGVWECTPQGMPSFDAGMISTVVHEFSHSYCNPIVDAHLADLREAGERMFPAVAAKMRRQAYGNWGTVMRESMVRAAEARYAAAYQGSEGEQASIRYNEERGFTWIGGLSDLLEQYEEQRDRYPNLDAFFPEIVKFFNGISRKVAEEGAKVPKVVRTLPADGDRDVDPGLQEITVVFDRDMSTKSWAWTGDPKVMPETPKGAQPSWRDARTCVLPVRMQPGRTYTFGINGGRFTGFRGKDNTPAEAVVVTFSTRGDGKGK